MSGGTPRDTGDDVGLNSAVPADWPRRVAILGIGLLGGSVAMAIRKARPNVEVIGWSRRESTTEQARQLGVIDEIAPSAEQACAGCDVVVVATPVDRIAAQVITALEASPPECRVTDVGSTKAKIVDQVSHHPLAAEKFVAAHPIAGKEKSGVRFATASLFTDRCVVLTPSDSTLPTAIAQVRSFWELTGANTLILDAARHDAYLAATSHVPHLVSAAVAKLLPADAVALVGTGWADTTRVAAGDPEMWGAICRENRHAIAAELHRFAESIQTLCQFMDRDDQAGMLIWLAEAKMIRDQVPTSTERD